MCIQIYHINVYIMICIYIENQDKHIIDIYIYRGVCCQGVLTTKYMDSSGRLEKNPPVHCTHINQLFFRNSSQVQTKKKCIRATLGWKYQCLYWCCLIMGTSIFSLWKNGSFLQGVYTQPPKSIPLCSKMSNRVNLVHNFGHQLISQFISN